MFWLCGWKPWALCLHGCSFRQSKNARFVWISKGTGSLAVPRRISWEGLHHWLWEVNGKWETLWESETSVFLCQPETFGILQLQDRDFKVFLMQGSKTFSCHSRLCKQLIDTFLALKKLETARQLCEKIETMRHVYTTRLWDPWNLTKILQDMWFLKDRSPPFLLYMFASSLNIAGFSFKG